MKNYQPFAASRHFFTCLMKLRILKNKVNAYRKVASTSPSYLEAHAGFFQIVYEGET